MELNGTIFLQIVIFLSLLIWLSRFLFSPILRLFDEREKRIEGALKTASSMNDLADERAKIFDDEFSKAKDKARETLSALKKEMESEYQKSLAAIKIKAKEELIKAQADLKTQEAETRKELLAKSNVIADDIVHSLLKQAL